jgi:hypothetical protein
MIRSAIAFILFSLLAGCHQGHDGELVLPFNHPANPYAEAAPPITVPPVQGPDAEPVVPILGEPAATSAPEAGPPPHQHHQ